MLCMCAALRKQQQHYVSLLLTKELDVARLAVRVMAVLLECPLVQELQTEGTSEVFGVEFLTHSSDTLA